MHSLPPILALGAALSLSGCLGLTPRPQTVTVSATGIEVAMSDRSTCIGTAPVPGTDWSGVLTGCASPYPYRVTFDPRGNVLRDGLEAVADAVGLTLAPVATVEIEGPLGNTWTFASPPPRED